MDSPSTTATATATTNGPITLTVAHRVGTQDLSIVYVAANNTEFPLAWNGACEGPYTIFLRAPNGALVQQWPSPGANCHLVFRVSLAPGESRTLRVVSTDHATTLDGQAIPAGPYTVTAYFRFLLYEGVEGPRAIAIIMPLTW